MSSVTPNSPNTVAVIISTAILAGLSGYFFGIFSSLGFAPIPFLANGGPNYKPHTESDTEEESEAEDIDEDILDHAPNWNNKLEQDVKDGLRMRAGKGKENVNSGASGTVKDGPATQSLASGDTRVESEECKMVLVVRTDLGMSKGISQPDATSIFLSMTY